jgi:hypothetical protein
MCGTSADNLANLVFSGASNAKIFRVWSHCEEYVTFLARPGSRLATLVSREMRDRMYIGTYYQKKGVLPVRSGGNPKGREKKFDQEKSYETFYRENVPEKPLRTHHDKPSR